jgi:hypothetical protein
VGRQGLALGQAEPDLGRVEGQVAQAPGNHGFESVHQDPAQVGPFPLVEHRHQEGAPVNTYLHRSDNYFLIQLKKYKKTTRFNPGAAFEWWFFRGSNP